MYVKGKRNEEKIYYLFIQHKIKMKKLNLCERKSYSNLEIKKNEIICSHFCLLMRFV